MSKAEVTEFFHNKKVERINRLNRNYTNKSGEEISSIQRGDIFPFVLLKDGKTLFSRDYFERPILCKTVPENFENLSYWSISDVLVKRPNLSFVELSARKEAPIFSSKMDYNDFRNFLKKRNYRIFIFPYKTPDGDTENFGFFMHRVTHLLGRFNTYTKNGRQLMISMELVVPYVDFGHEKNAKYSTNGVIYNLKNFDTFDYFAFDKIEREFSRKGKKINYWDLGFLSNFVIDNNIGDLDFIQRQIDRYKKLPEDVQALFDIPSVLL